MVQTQTHITADGAKIGYRIHGAGSSSSSSSSSSPSPPLVLIMGLSGVMDDWSPFVEEVAKSRTVLISDHRGIGDSYVPEDWDFELSHDIMADDILSLLKSLGEQWKVVDVLGWSMGGHITQRLATREKAQKGDRGMLDVGEGIHVRKIILAATMTKLPRGDINMQKMEEEGNKIKDKTERKKWLTTQMMELQYDPASLSSSSYLKDTLDRRIEVSLKTRRPQEIIGLQFLAIQSYRSVNDLHRIPESVPVLVLHGNKDRMVAYSESEPFLREIKHAKRIDMADGPEEGAKKGDFGHFWFDYYGSPYWAKKVATFLDSSSAPTAKL